MVMIEKKFLSYALISEQRGSRGEANQLREAVRGKVGIRLGRARRCRHAGQGQINPDQVTPQRGSAGSSA